MKIRFRDWFLFIIMAVFCLGLWFKFGYPRFAVVDLSVNKESALAKAKDYLKSGGINPDEYSLAEVFESDNWADRYLQKTLGVSSDDFIIKHRYDLFYWEVRFFKELEKEEYRIRISSKTGKVIGYAHLIEDIEARPDLGRELSKEKARKFLADKFGFDFNNYDFFEERAKRFDKRVDYDFLWERKGVYIPWQKDQGQAKLIIGATISGNEVREFHAQVLDIPEKFRRYIENQLSSGEYLSSFSFLVLVVFLIIAISIIVGKRQSLAIRSSYKFYLYLMLFLVLLNALLFLNNIQQLLMAYLTSVGLTSFIGLYAVKLIINAVYLGVIFILPGLAGESLRNEVMPQNKHASFFHYIKSSFFTRQVGSSILLGYLLFVILLGLQALVMYFGQQHLGVWKEWVRLTGLSSSYFPFFAAFAIGLDAALSEEIVFRLFGITLIKKYLRSMILALVISSVIWGFGHSSYAVFPFWFRAVEVSLMGIIFGVVYLRYGIIAVIAAHYAFDVFWGVSAYLLGKSSSGMFISSLAVMSLPLVIALICFFINAEDKEKDAHLLLNKIQEYNLNMLINFIRSKKEGGLDSQSVRRELLEHNWDVDLVDLAIEAVFLVKKT